MAYRRKVLIVEDNDLNREILYEILADYYDVIQACNGLEALEMVQKNKDTALILLDVRMPVMDGLTFLDHIKADQDLANIPVIVITQDNNEEDELVALDRGAVDFVPKPYRPQIILHKVTALITLQENAAMINMLQSDRLTGLFTKEFFYEKLREILTNDPDGEYCVICSNIENFKLVNDFFGINRGNELLKEVGNLSQEIIGENGFCGRYGADRFIYVQKCPKDEKDRLDIAWNRVKKSLILNKVVIRWGVYYIHDKSIPVETMCDRAILTVDSIKGKYLQYSAVYDDSLREKLLKEQNITSTMEDALKNGEFTVYLQPQYNLNGNTLSGAEALVRWIHPTKGMVPPFEFIPIFEKNGFVRKLDQYIWEQVCIKLAEWKKLGYPQIPVSVNVSRADIFPGDLVETIKAITERHGIDPKYLHLEITEGSCAENPKQVIDTIKDLRKLGFVVEMDDFGSGHSSLNMISQLDVDTIKIDQGFVRDEVAKPANQSILSSIINLAHHLGLEVVAEGVETREQVNRLLEYDCDFVQGYFFAKPMPISDYEKILAAMSGFEGLTEEKKPRETHAKTILLIDDDPNYLEVLKNAFKNDFDILNVKSCKEALEKINVEFAQTSLSAVLLSASLPREESLKFIASTRQTAAMWYVPIMVTLNNLECVNETELLSKADDFLCKRHPVFDLKRRVIRMIDLASYRRKEHFCDDDNNLDCLTSFLNRKGFENVAGSIKENGMPYAVCAFSIDGIEISDSCHEHKDGDEIVASFAGLLNGLIRREDIKCRYSKNEIIIILKNVEEIKHIKDKGEYICRLFEEFTRGDTNASCSCGVAACPGAGTGFREVFEMADKALYKAKFEHKGHCVVYEND
ncbi:MAG: EAL domain-containing protein [Erysipelotrichaceae bacterium]|nr:EAL domain-containing protein [Erysipelotrichaceae bacterium]